MSREQYGVRHVWESFKKVAAEETFGTPAQNLAVTAMTKWASSEPGSALSPPRAMREALATSIAGAELTDRAIVKMASAGHYTAEERDFLLDLNATAALEDLKGLLKTSASLSELLANPTAQGAVAGGLLGAGIGAWKDDDNRARGALLYGVPGAVIGGVAGQGYGSWAQGRRDAAANEAKKVIDEAAAVASAQEAQRIAASARAASEVADKAKAVSDARRWHQNLWDAAEMFTTHSDNATREYAKHLRAQLHAYKDSIVEHATANPQGIHKRLVQAMGIDGGQKALKLIVDQARTLHKNGN